MVPRSHQPRRGQRAARRRRAPGAAACAAAAAAAATATAACGRRAAARAVAVPHAGVRGYSRAPLHAGWRLCLVAAVALAGRTAAPSRNSERRPEAGHAVVAVTVAAAFTAFGTTAAVRAAAGLAAAAAGGATILCLGMPPATAPLCASWRLFRGARGLAGSHAQGCIFRRRGGPAGRIRGITPPFHCPRAAGRLAGAGSAAAAAAAPHGSPRAGAAGRFDKVPCVQYHARRRRTGGRAATAAVPCIAGIPRGGGPAGRGRAFASSHGGGEGSGIAAVRPGVKGRDEGRQTAQVGAANSQDHAARVQRGAVRQRGAGVGDAAAWAGDGLERDDLGGSRGGQSEMGGQGHADRGAYML
jgi:hypothetical protein